MFAADQFGLASVLDEVKRAAVAGAPGSEPSPLLIELARDGRTFAAWQAGTREKRP